MPRILITYSTRKGDSKRIAEAVAGGVKRTGVETVLTEASEELDGSAFDFVFVGSEVHGGAFGEPARLFLDENKWEGRQLAVFACHYGDKEALGRVVEELSRRKARVVNSLNVQAGSPWNVVGAGKKLSEEDLIRAAGFGERTVNNAFNFRVKKSCEKRRISGYVK